MLLQPLIICSKVVITLKLSFTYLMDPWLTCATLLVIADVPNTLQLRMPTSEQENGHIALGHSIVYMALL